MIAWALSLALFALSLGLAALLVALASRGLLRRDPRRAHRFALLVLLAALAALPFRFLPLARERAVASASATETVSPRPAPAEEVHFREEIADLEARIAAAELALGADAGTGSVAGAVAGGGAREAAIRPDLTDRPAALTRLVTAFAAAVADGGGREFLRGALVLHLLGLVVVVARRGRRLLATRSLIGRARPLREPGIRNAWRRLAGPDATRVRLLVSAEIDSPACFGLFRPVILLPEAALAGSRPEAIDWALRHELVHVRRGDCLLSPLQHLLVAVAWFQPAVWWLERELIRLRELSCDQLVVAASGSRRSYALALIAFAPEGGPRPPRSLDAPAFVPWAAGKSFLHRRIEMLAHNPPAQRPLLAGVRLGALVGAALALWFADVGLASQIVLPQEPPATSAEPVPTSESIVTEEAFEEDSILEEEEVIAEQIVTDSSAPFDRVGEQDQIRMGINTREVDETLAFQLDIDPAQALVVSMVAPDSPAARARLAVHDVIVRVNGKPATLENLRAERDRSGGKTPVNLEIRRRARPATLTLWGETRGARPGPQGPGAIGFGGPVRAREVTPHPAGEAGPQGPGADGRRRDDYLREIAELRRRLAELAARVEQDPTLPTADPQAKKRAQLERRSAEEAARRAHAEALAAQEDAERRHLQTVVEDLRVRRHKIAVEIETLKELRGQIGAKEAESLERKIAEFDAQMQAITRQIDEVELHLRDAQRQARRGVLRTTSPEVDRNRPGPSGPLPATAEPGRGR